MTDFEKIGLVSGLWITLAAIINAVNTHWLAVATCLFFDAAVFTWLFGRAKDRARNRQERQQAALLARLEEETKAEQRGPRYVQNEEGFYVRDDDDL